MMGNIDLNFLVEKQKIETLSSEEQDFLRIAQCNGNNVLEVSDFYTEAKCYTSPADKQNYDPQTTFEKYRLSIIHSILISKSTHLTEKYPNFDLELLAKIIVQEAEGVIDINQLVDQLIAVLENNLSNYNEAGLLLLARVYVTIYNFGKLHEAWVSQGGIPFLPNDDTNTFVDQILEKLLQGKIKIGILSEKMQKQVTGSGLYDSISNRLEFPIEFFLDPLIIDINRTIVFETIIHESYHSFQDVSRLKMSFSEVEIEAYILANKALILRYGREEAKKIVEGKRSDKWEQKTEGVAKFITNKFAMAIRGMHEIGYEIALDELSGLHRSQEKIEAFKKFRFEVGSLETILRIMAAYVKKGKDDPSFLRYFQKRLEQEFGRDKIASEIDVEKPNLEPFSEKVFSTIEEMNGTIDEVTTPYIEKLYRQYCYVNYTEGVEVARKFMKERVIPVWYDVYSDALNRATIKFDGID